jgi:hypothetical protein
VSDKKINDGGPAFPTLDGRDGAGGPEYFSHEGMTLRDWFAGQALAAIVSKSPYGTVKHTGTPCETKNQAARGAYMYADAMLAVRKGGDA